MVPPKENTEILAKRYRELGGKIDIMRLDGTRLHGHHFDSRADYVEPTAKSLVYEAEMN